MSWHCIRLAVVGEPRRVERGWPDLRAGHGMIPADLPELRDQSTTGIVGQRTARMEHAAARRIHRARNLALDHLMRAALFDLRIGDRNRRQQRLGVWMA